MTAIGGASGIVNRRGSRPASSVPALRGGTFSGSPRQLSGCGGGSGKALSELRVLVWLFRAARFKRERQSFALKIRWRLRRLAGTADYAEAAQLVGQLAERVRCSSCGSIVRRRSRLVP